MKKKATKKPAKRPAKKKAAKKPAKKKAAKERAAAIERGEIVDESIAGGGGAAVVEPKVAPVPLTKEGEWSFESARRWWFTRYSNLS